MTNYVSIFIRDYSTITESIRRLMKSKTEWQWSNEQENALQMLKSTLASKTVWLILTLDEQQS